MGFVLVRRADDADVVGMVPRGASHEDIWIPLTLSDTVEGTPVSDWPEGIHDLPDNPRVVASEAADAGD